jgi:hypothetical protein
MAKFPVQVDGRTIEVQEFIDSDGDGHAISIDDRLYHMWRIPNTEPPLFYFMVKIRDTPRSLRAVHDKCIEMLAKVHCVYKDYEQRVRKAKEDAQRQRDKSLNTLVESAQ